IRALAIRPDYLEGSDATDHVFVGTRGGGVHRSLNGGGTWEPINWGLRGDGLSIRQLAISPNFASDSTLFVGTDAGLFKTHTPLASDRRDVSWFIAGNLTTGLGAQNQDQAVDSSAIVPPPGDGFQPSGLAGAFDQVAGGGLTAQALDSVTAVALSPLYNENAPSGGAQTTLFAGVWGGGVFRSTDKGATWTAVNTGLESRLIRSLALSPYYGTGTDRTVYASTFDNRVFVSRDNGQTWQQFGGTIDTRDVATLLAVPTSMTAANNEYTVYAGTAGRGVFGYTNPQVAAVPQAFLPAIRRNGG
ncbi:MAG TPA: hypothetical protein VHL09_01555, partial [Dehalococcoidia bacterium]|nr:hypothetical protein [Dehalococcoidia bacterium]